MNHEKDRSKQPKVSSLVEKTRILSKSRVIMTNFIQLRFTSDGLTIFSNCCKIALVLLLNDDAALDGRVENLLTEGDANDENELSRAISTEGDRNKGVAG